MKIFNRAIKLGGESRRIGTPIITILEVDPSENVTRARGLAVPTDGDRGYAVGCIFIHTDGSDETILYVNEGTATSADFNQVLSGVKKVEDTTATNTLTAEESGKVILLNSETEFATTLPAPAVGLNFKFIIKAAPVGANYTIATNGGDNVIQGLAVVNGASVAAADEDTITFTASAAVAGDWCELVSDGTNWYVSGQAVAATGIAFSAT